MNLAVLFPLRHAFVELASILRRTAVCQSDPFEQNHLGSKLCAVC